MNKSFVSMYDTMDQATLTEGQLQYILSKLKENEDLIKRMEAIETAQAEELSRLREETRSLRTSWRVVTKGLRLWSRISSTSLTRSRPRMRRPRLLESFSMRRRLQGMRRSPGWQRQLWQSLRILRSLLPSSRKSMKWATMRVTTSVWKESSTTYGTSTEMSTTGSYGWAYKVDGPVAQSWEVEYP